MEITLKVRLTDRIIDNEVTFQKEIIYIPVENIDFLNTKESVKEYVKEICPYLDKEALERETSHILVLGLDISF
jgi:hypothetical protein